MFDTQASLVTWQLNFEGKEKIVVSRVDLEPSTRQA
jgi:hypothetical protein